MMIDQATDPKETEIILNSIKSSIFELCLDSFACHVIEKIITKYEENDIKNIYEIALANFLQFCNNVNGLCIIKKIIFNAKEIGTKEIIKKIILENCNLLIYQIYGNYVIDTVLEVSYYLK
jgi:hypothetical protein